MRIILTIFCCLAAVCCNNDKFMVGGDEISGTDYRLTTQAEVDNFINVDNSGMVGNLVISGSDITDITDLFVSKAVSVVIENTSIVYLNWDSITCTSGSFTVRNNPELLTIETLPSFLFCGGDLRVEDNVQLCGEGIKAFITLKSIVGDVCITGNSEFGADVRGESVYYGFNMLLQLYEENVILSSVTMADNHPDAATRLDEIGTLAIQVKADYYLTTLAECLELVSYGDIAYSITFEGEGITTAGIDAVASQFTEVEGTVTLIGTSVSSLDTGGFFSTVKVGGVELYDNEQLVKVGAFNTYTSLTYNFIVDNSPLANFYWSNALTSLVSVGGDFILKDTFFIPIAIANLQSVGGDFKIINVTNNSKAIYHFPDMVSLTSVGGDIVIQDMPYFMQLTGLQHITEIGGSVYFEGCADTSVCAGWTNTSTGELKIGLDLINKWVQTGALEEDEVHVYYYDGTEYPYSTINDYTISGYLD